LAEIVESTLCFLWQDNNAVLGLTTAHPFKNDTILRLRKRPSPTSTNARIVRPVFGDLPAKWLRIPCAIDDYNHYMNGVDRSNQLRRNFTIHRAYERRIWRPLWYYVFDVCTVNSYLIQKGDTEDKSHKGQRPFRKALAEALLNTPYTTSNHGNYRAMSLANQHAQNHHWEQFPKRGYCI
jgi:Transposase IS4